jgi:hypothetical protein
VLERPSQHWYFISAPCMFGRVCGLDAVTGVEVARGREPDPGEEVR